MTTAGLAAGALVLSTLWFLRAEDVSRQFLLALFGGPGGRDARPRAGCCSRPHAWMRRRGRGGRYLLVAGSGPVADAFIARDGGSAVAGAAADRAGCADPPTRRRRRGATAAEQSPAARSWATSTTSRRSSTAGSWMTSRSASSLPTRCCCWSRSWPAAARRVGRATCRCRPARPCRSLEGGILEHLDGLAVVSVVPGPERAALHVVKRADGPRARTVALLVALPLLAVLALVIRVVDGGPVLFHQRRIGRDGRPFRMLKLRTMALDAEERLVDLAPHNEVTGLRVQAGARPAADAHRRRPAPHQPRRAAPAVERAAGRDEPRGAAAAVARGGRGLRAVAPPAAVRDAGDDRPVAGRGTQPPRLRPLGAPRPGLHRPLVAVAGPRDPGAHRSRRSSTATAAEAPAPRAGVAGADQRLSGGRAVSRGGRPSRRARGRAGAGTCRAASGCPRRPTCGDRRRPSSR